MAQTADFFQILRSNIDLLDEEKSSARMQDVYAFFSDTLVGHDFDRIGALDMGGEEASLYRDLGALPKGRGQ